MMAVGWIIFATTDSHRFAEIENEFEAAYLCPPTVLALVAAGPWSKIKHKNNPARATTNNPLLVPPSRDR
jgi:hypothetical protein